MEQALIISHIVGGTTALLVGLVLMLRPKGDQLHITMGWIYTVGMFTVCFSAFGIVAFYRFSFFLMVIGVLTFYNTYVGVRVVRRRKSQVVQWYDWVISSLTSAFGIGLIGYGLYLFQLNQGFHIAVLLSAIFGVFTFLNGFRDLRKFNAKKYGNSAWWLREHINNMGGSYIAAFTAFVVQNGDAFLPNSSYNWLLWVLPGVVGGFVIAKAIKKRGLGRT